MSRKKYTIEYIREYVEKEGYFLLSDKYINCMDKLEMKCAESHKFLMRFNNFKNRGDRCSECSGRKKKTVEFVRDTLAEEGYTLLSHNYENKDTHLYCKCPVGHITNSITWNNFRKGRRCFECFGTKKKTIEQIRKGFKLKGFELISSVYKGINFLLEIKCSKGHFVQMSWRSFGCGGVCPVCSVTRKKGIDFVREEFRKVGYVLVSEFYVNSQIPLEYVCFEGHMGRITRSHFKEGQRCSKCSSSGISKISQRWLDSLGIPEEYREYPVQVRGFIVDGFDPKTNIVYEFLGDFWHGNPERFSLEDINLINKKTFGQLHKETMDRLKFLKDAGYRVIYVWENDYNKNKESINELCLVGKH